MNANPHRPRIRALLLIVLVAVIGLGCATTNVVPTTAMERPLSAYRAAYFTSTSSLAEDISQNLFKLDESTAKKLSKTKLFDNVVIGTCSANCTEALNIHAEFTSVKKVSGAARFFLGMFAGEARVTATVTVTDANTHATLGEYEISCTSGSSGFSGDTNSTFERMAKAITQLIKKNFSK